MVYDREDLGENSAMIPGGSTQHHGPAQTSDPGLEGHHVPVSPSLNPVLKAGWNPAAFINKSLLLIVALNDSQ